MVGDDLAQVYPFDPRLPFTGPRGSDKPRPEVDPKTALEPGVVIADRFRIDEPIAFAEAGPAFLATDQESKDRLLVFEVQLAEADALRPAVAVQHPHLGVVVGLVAHGERDVLLAQYVPGLSVEAFADGASRLSKVDAVRFALRILDALLALHQAGAAHGFLRPAAVVMEPEARPRPVVTFAPSLLALSTYRSPERGEAGSPSVADDSWAAGALLYRMLTGKDPAAVGYMSEDEVGAAGIDDPVLRAALFHSLAADPSKRSDTLQPLRRELARWFADHAGDGSSHSSMMSRPPPLPPGLPGSSGSVPPPAPVSGAPPFSKSMPTEVAARKKTSTPLVFAAVAAVLGLGAAWGVSAWRSRPKVTVITTAAPQETGAAVAPSAVSLGEVAVTGESEGEGGVDRSLSCVAAYFPKDTFKKAPDLTWLCAEVDPRAGGEKLRVAVVQGAAGGAPTEAQQLFAKLGWYEMAAFGMIRASCCNDPKALELPEASSGCEPLAKAIDEVGKAVASKQPIDEPLSAFGKAAKCETDAKKASLFRRGGAPQPSEEAAFKDLMKTVSAP